MRPSGAPKQKWMPLPKLRWAVSGRVMSKVSGSGKRSWQVPDFDVDRYDAELRELDAAIRADGRVVFHDHRYVVEARKP
jgi:hypothetical protein